MSSELGGAGRDNAVIRDATREDDRAICELFERVTMDGELRMAVERGPSFYGLYDLQALVGQRVVVGEREGKLNAVASLLARECWLDGERARVGYLGDLRLDASARGGFPLLRAFGFSFEPFLKAAGAEVALTAIFDANKAAVRFLTRKTRRLPNKPIYHPWQKFEITNLHFTRRRRPRPASCEIRRAVEGELPAIAELLTEDHRQRPFGYVLDEASLGGRLERWPGLRIEDFFCAWRGSELVGVVAPWDAHAVKRYRVEEYGGSMRWIRPAFNLGALFFRYAKLPPVGGVIRYAYLTHQSVKDDYPEVFQALLDHVYAALQGTHLNFLTCCVLENDPFRGAFERYETTPIPAQLYLVSPPGSRFNDYPPPTGRPGFEMALV